MNAATKIVALVPLFVMVLKDGFRELTTQVVLARLAPLKNAVFTRHVQDTVDALVADGNLPPICLHACALLPFALIKNAVSLFATLRIVVSVEVVNNLRILVAN